MLPISILYEDNFFLAIDKPAGIVVNRAQSAAMGTIQDWAEEKLKLDTQGSELSASDFYGRAGIVHRIDKETSGILLIAKSPEVFDLLQGQFENRSVHKMYSTLVHGKLEGDGIIKAPVGRLPWDRRKFGVISEGRDAETKYKAGIFFQHVPEGLTFVEVEPLTGRTHQIRIHFKHIGHPVVSDPLYAGKHVYREDLQLCPRLFLHASRLTLHHPYTKESLTITSELPADLSDVMKKLQETGRAN